MTTWLNGRPATDWEAQAVKQGFQCAYERDLEQLAGLLAQYPGTLRPDEQRRSVSDIPWFD